MASVSFGEYLARICRPYIPTFPPPSRVVRYGFCILGLLIYAATFPTYARLPSSYRSQATAALMFSFPGALSRYLLSIYLNPVFEGIPLGTLTANLSGTALLGMFHVLQNRGTPFSAHACSILQGLIDGYCGTLTTVSTFAVELNTMKGSKRAWLYGSLSWVGSQLLLLVILVPSFTVGNVSKSITCA
jgi:CrcB protein